MSMNILRGFIITCLLLLISCSNNAETSKDVDYETTKQMMVDILQTEDGKKALSEVLNDDAMKQRLVIDSDAVKNALKEQFVSEQGSEIWANYFKDPSFVESFASSLEKEHIEMLKRAMNDSTFQRQMMEIFQDPGLSDHFLTILKSQAYREHLEKLIEQTLETPSFQGKVKKMIEQSEDDVSSDDSTEDEQNAKSDQVEKADDTNKKSDDEMEENEK